MVIDDVEAGAGDRAPDRDRRIGPPPDAEIRTISQGLTPDAPWKPFRRSLHAEFLDLSHFFQIATRNGVRCPRHLAGDYSSSEGHRTLAEKAFETLHGAIITGRLRPGTRLPIEDLAEALRMSPMPICEALRGLDAAGLVKNIPHRGARVSELSIADLAEVYEVRLALEVPAIRHAAERFDAGHALVAREILDALHAQSDYSSAEASATHAGFHFALYEAAGSAWLLRLIRPAWQTS